MNPQDPQQNPQSNTYLSGDQNADGFDTKPMASHGKTIAPIHAIDKPDAPISALANQPQQTVEASAPLSTLNAQEVTPNSTEVPQSDLSQVPASPQVQNVGGYVDPLSAVQPSTPPSEFQSQPSQLQQVIASAPPVGETPTAGRSKKPLIVGALIAAALLVFGGGGAAYALWYANPDKVLADAVANGIKSETMITNGSLLVNDDTNKGKITFDFETQSDNPKLAGSVEGTLKVEYPDFEVSLKGAGMVAETGDFYFKIDNADEVLDKALKTEYGAMYAEEPTMKPVIDKVRAFVKKIDGQWIKVENTYIEEYQKTYEKQQACTKKALDTFYKDSAQQKQVADLYIKYKFIVVKDTGKSESINGEDSVIYDLKFNAKKADNFSQAVEKTDIAKALSKCYETDEESGVDEYKPTKEELEDTQKTLDKLTTTVWIGRFSHNATKIQLKSSEDQYSYDANATLDNKTQPNLKAPSSSLNVKDLQKDVEDIMESAGSVYEGSQSQARTSVNEVNANILQKKVEAWAAMDVDGLYPELDQLKSTQREEVKLDENVAKAVSSDAPSAEHKDRIQYKTCEMGVGYSIYYWDETAGAISRDIGYGCGVNVDTGALPGLDFLRNSFPRFSN